MSKVSYIIVLYVLLVIPQQTITEGGDQLLGKPAPDWGKLRWVNSDPLQLGNLTKKVLLIQWWTEVIPFCKRSSEALNEFHQVFSQEDLMVIGIYYPNPFRFRTLDEITQVANRLGFKFPVAIDVDGKILQKYWLDVNVRRRSSTSFLIDQKGEICYIHLGGGYHQGGSKSHQQCQQNYKELKTQINELLRESAGKTTQLAVSEARLGGLKPNTPFREDQI